MAADLSDTFLQLNNGLIKLNIQSSSDKIYFFLKEI